jgi:hypothetical protein
MMVLEASPSLPPASFPSSYVRKSKVLVIIGGMATNFDVHIDIGIKCGSLGNMLTGFSLAFSF